ncbi:MAG TPA: DUF3189 family protein [Syntrophomonadaceae bacterium]|nr:DUF3189 family protein [Syntrophomonadaceae bacterium]
MVIIYHCFGGSHSSVTAAAIHLGMLRKDRIPSARELNELPYYDKTSEADFGTIRYMGKDEWDNDVYILGKKSMGDRYNAILTGVAALLGQSTAILPVNCMSHVNWSMKIGGFISRRLQIEFLGRPIVIWGTQKAFYHLVKLVEEVQAYLRHVAV